LQKTNHTRLALSQQKLWKRGGPTRVRAVTLPNANGEIPPPPLEISGLPTCPASHPHPHLFTPDPSPRQRAKICSVPKQGSTHPRYIRPRCQLQESGGKSRRLGRRAQFSPSVEAGRGATNPRWQACACAPSSRRAVLPAPLRCCLRSEEHA
jgi:hypothetical protein